MSLWSGYPSRRSLNDFISMCWDRWNDKTPPNIREIIFKCADSDYSDSDFYSKSKLINTPHVYCNGTGSAKDMLSKLSQIVDKDSLSFVNTYGFTYASIFAYNTLSREMCRKGSTGYKDCRVYISYFRYKYKGKSYSFGLAFRGTSSGRNEAESLTNLNEILKEATHKLTEDFINQCRKAVRERSVQCLVS